ncbi:hypothetical protein SCMC78_00220 [Streptomyces sp. CMC78]|uniref:Uncharacterized protein n=1 Tax=Streptomyces sp. CMC78 TaxID=3231512 RepID=A0AB33KFI7_9ACTN
MVAQAVRGDRRIRRRKPLLSAHGGQNFRKLRDRARFGVKGEQGRPRVLKDRIQGISGHDVGSFPERVVDIVESPPDPPSGRLAFSCAESLEAERKRTPRALPPARLPCPMRIRPDTKKSALGADSTEYPEGPPR